MLALAWPAAAWQDGLPKTVKEIRQRYAEAHQAIAQMDENGVHNQVTLVVQRNMPASGLRTVTLTCYFEEYQDEDEEMAGNMDYLPFFLTSRSNLAVWVDYEEYLFDPMSGNPIFIFLQRDTEDGGKDETRYYFGPDGLISENIKGERVMSSGAAYQAAIHLRDSMIEKMSY